MKILWQRLVAILAGMVTIVGIVVVAPASALADGDKTYYAVTAGGYADGGDSYFYSADNGIDLCNGRSAGKWVGLQVELWDFDAGDYRSWKQLYNGDGSGGQVDYCSGWNFGSTIAELQPLRFRVCRQTGTPGEAYDCGDWTEATA